MKMHVIVLGWAQSEVNVTVLILQVQCNAVKSCKKFGLPDVKCATTLKHLFPATSSSGSKKRKFNPAEECVASDAHRKRKAANLRVRPKNISVVVLESMPTHVPKGHVRSKLVKKGNVKQILFRRNMTPDEVRAILVREFRGINVQTAQFLQCKPSNVLCLSHDQELGGEGVIDLAGQGSLYLTLKPVEVSVLTRYYINIHSKMVLLLEGGSRMTGTIYIFGLLGQNTIGHNCKF